MAGAMTDPDPARPARKPWRLWVLEAIVSLQLLAAVVRGVPAVAAAGRRLLAPPGLWWLLETLFSVVVTILLVLGIERVFRRSDVVAPAAGAFWWLNGVDGAIRSIGAPPDPDLKRFLYEGVPAASEIAALVVVHGLLLWLAGSLLWHRATRRYLAGAPPPDAAGSPGPAAGI
jgi:hypothetical protein